MKARVDPVRLDLLAIVHMPLRRRSRARAALNLTAVIGVPVLLIVSLLRLVGVLP